MNKVIKRIGVTGIFALVLVLVGCASQGQIEPASERLGMAKSAIQQARVSNADTLAPSLLNEAERKAASAERAINEGQGLTAERLAHEATLDAELARLEADKSQNQRALVELEDAINELEYQLSTVR